MKEEAPGHRAALALLSVVLAGACWGLSAVLAVTAFERGVPPVRMAQARVAVAMALLGPYLAWRQRGLLRPPPGAGPALVGFGLSVALVNAAYYVAIDRLSVGVAISVQYTAPVLLLALGAVRGGSRPGALGWAAALLTVAGVVLVTGALHASGLDLAGVGAAAGSAVTFASYLLTAEAAGRRGCHPATILFWGFLVAVAFWTVAAPWWSWPAGRLADRRAALAVVGVGVVGTLLPFLLTVRAVRVLSPALAGVAATVEPPFATAFAWALLGQRLEPVQAVGAALVLAGVGLAHRAASVRAETVAVEVAP
ncbi:MAG TPA: DMT family transporter [Actinomycetota bacterium]|nr:DMT family transporter [Actinomycetota bacterium]